MHRVLARNIGLGQFKHIIADGSIPPCDQGPTHLQCGERWHDYVSKIHATGVAQRDDLTPFHHHHSLISISDDATAISLILPDFVQAFGAAT